MGIFSEKAWMGVAGQSGLVRGAGAGAHQQPVGLKRHHIIDRRNIIPDDLQLGAQLAQVLDQVVGERIVIINDQNHEEASFRFAAYCFEIARAFNIPFALLQVSRYSVSGSESATMPAPAWT